MKEEMMNSEYAKAYFKFSEAEDYPGVILDFLLKRIKGKVVLDIGCGNGKYLKLLSLSIRKGYGIDISGSQIEFAMNNKNHLKFFNQSAENLPLQDESVDVIICTWAFGSIHDDRERLKVLSEAKRVLKMGGVIYVVENFIFSEFEYIISRDDSMIGTKEINNWLIRNNFKKVETLKTFFNFISLNDAKEIFSFFWGKESSLKIKDNKISHKVNLYEWRKNEYL